MNPESVRPDHHTAAWHSKISVGDVTRLEATEHVGNKFSLRESIHLKSVTLLLLSVLTQVTIKLRFLQSMKPSCFIEKGGYKYIKIK